MPLNPFGRRLILLLASLVLALLTVEASVRIVFPAYDPSGHVRFTHLADGTAIGPRNVTRRQIKNTGDYDVDVRFNASGLRDSKSLGASTPDSIVVAGDSFAFGWGVDERARFSNLLEDKLGRPVFNVASGSADFDGYDSLLRHAEANGAVARTVIVSVCMENDLREYGGAPERPAADNAGLEAFLTEHSAAYFLAASAVHRTPQRRRIAARLGLVIPNLAAVAESETSEAAVRSSARRLERLIAGRRAIVLIVPSRALWVGTDAHRRDAARAHESFVGLLRDDGIDVVDPRETFEREGRPLAFHFANDGHWNAAGHRVAADALAASIQAASEPHHHSP